MYLTITKYKKENRHTFAVFTENKYAAIHSGAISATAYRNAFDRALVSDEVVMTQICNDEEKTIYKVADLSFLA
jgi:hypothetical protein